jgi:multicomponent Na+:H+ antiporter subunit C
MQILCAFLVGIMIAASIYLILDRNLIRFIFGLVLASNAINLLILTAGRLASRRPPLIPDKMTMGQELFANALPQALILTAIVIGFALLSFVFILFYRAYQALETVETELMRAAEGDADDHLPESRTACGGPL